MQTADTETQIFEEIFRETLGKEKGLSDNPADRGGKTMDGITEAVARANGYTGAMEDMTVADEMRIYRSSYWEPLRLGIILDLSTAFFPTKRVVAKLFDMGVNCGVGTAGILLQRALKVFKIHDVPLPDLKADGVIGPTTIAELKAFMTSRGPDGLTVLLRALNDLQGARYIEIAETDRTQQVFVFGWLLNRVN